MADRSERTSGSTRAAPDDDLRAPVMGESPSFPSRASLEALRDAASGLRLYRVSFAANLAVAAIWPFAFLLIVVAATLVARRMGSGDAYDRVPVIVVALASGTPHVTMILALARVLAFSRTCRATAMLVTAASVLVIGFLANAAALSVALVANLVGDSAPNA